MSVVPFGNGLPLDYPLNDPQASPGKELVAVVQTRARREMVAEWGGSSESFCAGAPSARLERPSILNRP